MKERILVTGGCGYIGSHTIVDLMEHNYQVVSIDNFVRSNPAIFEGIRKITGKNVLNLELDLTDKEAVHCIGEHLSGVTGIIHFAALKSVPESVEKPLLYYDNNIQSLINILKMAENAGIPKFVFSSSCTVYGDTAELPVREETPMGEAQNPYGLTKQIGEQIIRDHIRSGSKMKTALLRYFNPVGAHPSAEIGELPIDVPNNLVPFITQTAAGIRQELTVFGDDYDTRDGSCIRDYVHVMDIASAHRKAMEYLSGKGPEGLCEVFNLGTGIGVTVLEVINAFEQATGVDLKYKIGPRRPGDIAAVYSDNAKAKNVLGWEIRYGLEEMMRTAWEWEKRMGSVAGT